MRAALVAMAVIGCAALGVAAEPGLGLRVRAQDGDWVLDQASSAPPTSATAAAFQYEPQNVTPPNELPHLPSAQLPAQTDPPLRQSLPIVVPTNTSFLASYTSGTGDDLGIVDLDLRSTLVFPRVPGFMITPGFAAHLLSGPESTDLPPTLYDNWVEFRWLKKWNDRWAMDLALTPALFTDYENMSSEAFRMMGRAIALYTVSPTLQLAFGVIYLDREDLVALPGAGAIWTPRENTKVEILFPRPRVMYRLQHSTELTRWVYLGGELGGGSWAIQRTPPQIGLPVVGFDPDLDDVVTYNALRMYIGYEARREKGFSPRWEAGWSFGRELEYESGQGNTDLPAAALLRFGGSF
jgi:hypothetical protein